MSLPSGYTKLEYIESTGTQYIDTEVYPSETRILIDAYILESNTGNDHHIASCSWAETGKSELFNTMRLRADRTGFAVRYGNGNLRNIEHQGSVYGRHIFDRNFLASPYTAQVDEAASLTLTPSTVGSILCYLPLFAYRKNSGACSGFISMRLYSCKIWKTTEGVSLVRDYIPCKNASGVVGLWDDVNSKFYANAGTGSFAAGPEAVDLTAHKTLINGTAYTVQGGKCMVDGTIYNILKGRTLIDGTGYDITFPSAGTKLSALDVGQSVFANVNGAKKEFLVVHQGKPSSLYDDSCNGTWLLMKDVYENRQWHSSDVNKLESSTIHSYLNSTFLNLFDSNIRDAIKQVKLPYRKNGGSGGTDQSGANGLSAKIFLLSGYEVGWTTSDSSYFPVDGAKLDYFAASISGNSKRIAYLNGSATGWWLRSPFTYYTNVVWHVNTGGSGFSGYASYPNGIRPCIILPSDVLVDAEFNLIA